MAKPSELSPKQRTEAVLAVLALLLREESAARIARRAEMHQAAKLFELLPKRPTNCGRWTSPMCRFPATAGCMR